MSCFIPVEKKEAEPLLSLAHTQPIPTSLIHLHRLPKHLPSPSYIQGQCGLYQASIGYHRNTFVQNRFFSASVSERRGGGGDVARGSPPASWVTSFLLSMDIHILFLCVAFILCERKKLIIRADDKRPKNVPKTFLAAEMTTAAAAKKRSGPQKLHSCGR